MLTRKGRLRCDACGKKQAKRGEVLTVHAWSYGPKARFDPVESVRMQLATHFCSYSCLLNRTIDEVLIDATPADVIGR